MYASHFSTAYGPGVVYATAEGVVKVELPDAGRSDATSQTGQQSGLGPSKITVHAAGMLQRYFLGERVDFSDVPVVFDGLTPFRRKILTAIRKLQYGEISTYGQVARECGSPSAARAVGGALASNPIPVIVPCHRIVASDGGLTGFSAPGGMRTKLELLKMEGVVFKGELVVTNQLVMHRSSSQ